jgi:hypothetical protein
MWSWARSSIASKLDDVAERGIIRAVVTGDHAELAVQWQPKMAIRRRALSPGLKREHLKKSRRCWVYAAQTQCMLYWDNLHRPEQRAMRMGLSFFTAPIARPDFPLHWTLSGWAGTASRTLNPKDTGREIGPKGYFKENDKDHHHSWFPRYEQELNPGLLGFEVNVLTTTHPITIIHDSQAFNLQAFHYVISFNCTPSTTYIVCVFDNLTWW